MSILKLAALGYSTIAVSDDCFYYYCCCCKNQCFISIAHGVVKQHFHQCLPPVLAPVPACFSHLFISSEPHS